MVNIGEPKHKQQVLIWPLIRRARRKIFRMATRFRHQLQAASLSARFELAGHNIWLMGNERKLLALKNRYAGRRAFIIGNGPSLRNTDIKKIEGEITIGCNGIFLLFKELGFQPTFYTVEDRLVAEDRSPIINRLKGMIKIFPIDLRKWLAPDDDTIYINFVRQYNDFPRFSPAFEQLAYWGGTVTFLNLQFAYYLGIREVYLIGVDHRYHAPSVTDEVKGVVITSHTQDINHFHRDYFGPGYRWHDPKVERMEQAYREAKRFFENHGGIIYNATVGGELEVFPRVEYSQIVGNL